MQAAVGREGFGWLGRETGRERGPTGNQVPLGSPEAGSRAGRQAGPGKVGAAVDRREAMAGKAEVPACAIGGLPAEAG